MRGCSGCWGGMRRERMANALELIEKLAALVASRRLKLIRYHGLLAPNAARASRSCRPR